MKKKFYLLKTDYDTYTLSLTESEAKVIKWFLMNFCDDYSISELDLDNSYVYTVDI